MQRFDRVAVGLLHVTITTSNLRETMQLPTRVVAYTEHNNLLSFDNSICPLPLDAMDLRPESPYMVVFLL